MQNNIPIAYIAIDVDDFKQINDRFGHDTGDKVLKKIVHVLKQKFRSTDCFVRFGGDEFAVILLDYKKQSSFLIRRIEEINEELLHPDDDMPPITISVGAVISTDGYSNEIYLNADKALYKSKNKGKGICTVYNDMQINSFEKDSEDTLYTESIHYLNNELKVIVEQKQRLRSLLMVKNKPVCFMTGFYEEGLPVYSFNGFFPESLGYTLQEFEQEASHGFYYLIHEDDRKKIFKHHYEKEINEGKIYEEKVRLCCKSGDYSWFNVEYILTKTSDKKIFWMASFKNIDNNIIGNLCADDYRMAAIIDCEKDSIIIEKGAYMASKRELNIQKEYNYTALISQAVLETVQESERESYLEKSSISNICKKILSGGMYEFNVYQKWGSGDYRMVRHKYRYIAEKSHLILYTWEILGHMAEIDELTDALNENGFYRVTENILKEKNNIEKYSLLYFNISGFKAFNSMLGKEKADMILRFAIRNISKSKLDPLVVGRLFSDHFACLIDRSKFDLKVISSICDRYFEIDGNNILVQMRCGILHIDNINESVRSMCDKAKLAKTQISNEHAVPYHIFDKVLNDKYVQQKHVLNQVGNALERKEIKVYYQPVVDIKTRKISSAEALIRWILPGGLVMSPAVFIPALEEQGYISDVDSYVQNTVCAILEKRYLNNKNIVPISVNVSRMDFLNSEFSDKLKKLISTIDIIKEYMRFEVTESSFTEVGKTGEDLLKILKDHGIKILMDDFGTGFSTLSGITSQQFDIVKIDMSFIHGIGKNNGSEAVIENVIAMCHALNMKVVAEGVETEEHYKFLRDVDCDYVQGYYFYKPMPEDEFEKLLDENVD